jgi:hydrogenase expression/formation protein HypD
VNPPDFNDAPAAKKLLSEISFLAETTGPVKIMEVCGTHTMEIGRLGLRSLLPSNIELVSGPGCPVCVTPGACIDSAAYLSVEKGVRIVSYGDMIRVPGNVASLETARSKGAHIDVVTSPLEALEIAKKHPEQEVVFFAVGFETTAPATAMSIENAYNRGIRNLSFLMSHRTVPPVLKALIDDKSISISGFLLPGHVSAIIGEAPYHLLDNYGIPGVITGFEALDILLGIFKVCDMLEKKKPEIVNAYSRTVKKNGNPLAIKICEKIFEPCDAVWRGIGMIPESGLAIRNLYSQFDAALRHNLNIDVAATAVQPQGCSCGTVLKGIIKPDQCQLFKNLCTPQTPVGPCMVSSEGACAAYFRYGA